MFPALPDEERDWLGVDLAFAFAHYDRQNGRGLRRDGEALPGAMRAARAGRYSASSRTPVAPSPVSSIALKRS